jgi:hypothetical protein
MRILCALLGVILTASSLLAGETEGKEGLFFLDSGPIRVREQFLIGMGYLAFDPASADVLDRGALRIDVVQSETNTFARSSSVNHLLDTRKQRGRVDLPDLRALQAPRAGSGVYFADGEMTRTSIALRRGVGSGVDLSVTVPLLRSSGGDLDGVVENFHRAFGLARSGRTGALRNNYTVYTRDASGREVFRDVSSETRLGDIIVGMKVKVPLRSGNWKMAVENIVKLPTGSESNLQSSGGTDYGSQLLLTRYFGRSCVHGAAGLVHTAKSEVFGTKAQTLGSMMLAYEHAVGQRSSAVAQLTASESPFRSLGIDGLSANAYLIDLGMKHAVTARTVAFLAVSENLASYGSSADIGLHAGFTWTK